LDTPDLIEEIDHFPERFKSAIGKGSARAFALQCGFSSMEMLQYLAGKSEPTRLTLIAIAHTADVNLEWLMTGEGPMKKTKDPGMIGGDLYDAIIHSVEECLLKRDRTLPTTKKLEIYHYFYGLFKDSSEVNKELVEIFFEVAFDNMLSDNAVEC
jgi:transcriptional regulator with XRE-family HTH domain